jgi:uncharacterized Zn finger protein
MADIYFNCQRCQQHLVIDAAGAGITVKCPTCGELLVVPEPMEDKARTQEVLPFEYHKTSRAHPKAPGEHTKAA